MAERVRVEEVVARAQVQVTHASAELGGVGGEPSRLHERNERREFAVRQDAQRDEQILFEIHLTGVRGWREEPPGAVERSEDRALMHADPHDRVFSRTDAAGRRGARARATRLRVRAVIEAASRDDEGRADRAVNPP